MYCVLVLANIKCVAINVIYMVELKDRVLAAWGPSSISAVAELVSIKNYVQGLKNISEKICLTLYLF